MFKVKLVFFTMTQRFNYQRNPLNIGAPRWGGPPYNEINALRRANQDLSASAYMLRRRLNGLLEERQRYIHWDLFVKYKNETEQKYKELEERYKQLEAEKKTAEEQKQEMENPKDASVKVKPDKETQSQKGVEEMLEHQQECKHMKEEPKDEEEQLEQLKNNYKVLLQNYTNLMELHGQRKCCEQETDTTKDQKKQEKQEQMEVEEKEKQEKKERGKWRLFRKFFAERGIEEAAELQDRYETL